jgi:hypothetical protein
MGSSGFLVQRTERAAILLAVLLPLAACTTTQQSLPTRDTAFAAGVELPVGEGREILVNECLNCHELAALELFRDFYDRDLWRSLVISMRANGAEVDDTEVDVLADYLARHFGTQ